MIITMGGSQNDQASSALLQQNNGHGPGGEERRLVAEPNSSSSSTSKIDDKAARASAKTTTMRTILGKGREKQKSTTAGIPKRFTDMKTNVVLCKNVAAALNTTTTISENGEAASVEATKKKKMVVKKKTATSSTTLATTKSSETGGVSSAAKRRQGERKNSIKQSTTTNKNKGNKEEESDTTRRKEGQTTGSVKTIAKKKAGEASSLSLGRTKRRVKFQGQRVQNNHDSDEEDNKDGVLRATKKKENGIITKVRKEAKSINPIDTKAKRALLMKGKPKVAVKVIDEIKKKKKKSVAHTVKHKQNIEISADQAQEHFKHHQTWGGLGSIVDEFHKFYFRRTGIDGCRVGGIIRITFAILFLLDRWVLARDLDFLMSPSRGVIPSLALYNSSAVTAEEYDYKAWSLFHLNHSVVDGDVLLWKLHWLGLAQGGLLLLGFFPRFQLLGIYLNIVSFHRHNDVLFDYEDTMMRLWCFFLMFLPLHEFTIYDVFWKRRGRNTSWPMWPFRIWQIEMCLIFFSSGVSKWLDSNNIWMEGTALYWMTCKSETYPGLFDPFIVFNHMLPLKLLCWYIFCMENICWIGVWMKDTAVDFITVMMLIHLGFEVTTNCLYFNWLVIMGWMTFFVQPDYCTPLERRRFLRQGVQSPPHPPRVPTGLSGLPIKLFIILLTLGFAVDTFPTQLLMKESARAALQDIHVQFFDPVLKFSGLWQGPWHLYRTEPFTENSYFQAFIQIKDEEIVDFRSPTWRIMSWWERKMSTRMMKFYGNLAASPKIWVNFCEQIAKNTKGKSMAVQLLRVFERARPLEEGDTLSWIHRSSDRGWENLAVVRLCTDAYDHCKDLAGQGACETSPQFMNETCRKTCGFCIHSEVKWGNQTGVEGSTEGHNIGNDGDKYYSYKKPEGSPEESECRIVDGTIVHT